MMMADKESRAEIYSAAVDRGQASILFRDAVAMVDQSPALDSRIQRSGGPGREFNLADLSTGSLFRPISSESKGRGKSGPRPHCALLDEVHEHPTGAMVEFMRAGTKGRTQSLVLMITNSGFDQQTVCFQWHEYVTRICSGAEENDSIFGYVCGLDEGDDWADRTVWTKANPLLGVTIPESYIEELVEEAKGMPSKQSIVRRLNFCEWVGSAEVWIPAATWMPLGEGYDEDDLEGQQCYGGLDLSWSRDLTSLVLAFPDIDGRERTLCYFWLPEDGLRERESYDRVPYTEWVASGHLRVTPGAAIDIAHVASEIQEICARFQVKGIAFDRARAKNLISEFGKIGFDVYEYDPRVGGMESGIPLVPWGQGYVGMAPAVDALENSVIGGRFRHNSHPILTWNCSNVLLEQDPAGNRKFNKARATGRIDGMVSAAMAFGLLASVPGEKGPSVYEIRGMVVL